MSMRRRIAVPADGSSYGQQNGTLNTGGGSSSGVSLGASPPPKENAILVTADLVSDVQVAIDGSVTTIDGVASDGLIVLLTAQTDPKENGLYKAYSGAAWDEYNSTAHVDGLVVNILEGDVYKDSSWRLVTDGDIDRGSTPLEFLQFPYLDHAKAITNATPGLLTVPAAATIPGTFTPFPNAVWATSANGFGTDELDPIHFGPNPLPAGPFSFSGWRHSGPYYFDVSILCNHAATSGMVYVAIARNGALVQEVIRKFITTTEERHHGGVNVTIDAVAGDTIDVFLYDPTLTGYGVQVQEVYVDIIAGNRR